MSLYTNLRNLCTASLALVLVLSLASESTAQGQSKQGAKGVANASLLRLTKDDSGECLSMADTTLVVPGHGQIVFLAPMDFEVNNVVWDPNKVTYNKNKPLLAATNAKSSGSFGKGRAYILRVRRTCVEGESPQSVQQGSSSAADLSCIPPKTVYELNVTCGGADDVPPRVMVDP